MGTRLPVQWRSILPFCLLLAVFAGAPSAQAAEETLRVPVAAGAPQVDGVLDDDIWTVASEDTVEFDGTLSTETLRSVTLRLAHNGTHLFVAMSFKPGGGTHPDDFVLLTFDPDNGATAPVGRTDLLRHGWAAPVLLDDKTWNGSAWVRDADAGCAVDGSAARTEDAGTWHYEIVKPLTGDTCDMDASAGATIGMRFEFRENMPAPMHGDDFRWPRGTTYMDVTGNDNGQLDEAAAWADVRLEGDATDGASDPNGEGNVSQRPGDGAVGSGATGADGGSIDGATGPDSGSRDGSDQGQRSGDPTAGGDGDAAEAPALSGVVTLLVVCLGAVFGRRHS